MPSLYTVHLAFATSILIRFRVIHRRIKKKSILVITQSDSKFARCLQDDRKCLLPSQYSCVLCTLKVTFDWRGESQFEYAQNHVFIPILSHQDTLGPIQSQIPSMSYRRVRDNAISDPAILSTIHLNGLASKHITISKSKKLYINDSTVHPSSSFPIRRLHGPGNLPLADELI